MDFKLPKWLRKPAVELPDWARIKADRSTEPKGPGVIIEVDTAKAMQEWQTRLGNPAPDQYWLETAYQCAKMDIQAALEGTPFDPRATNRPIEIHFTRSEQHALHRHPEGRGIHAATKGKEAR